jgi:uncharacterized protein (TIGR02147 family)
MKKSKVPVVFNYTNYRKFLKDSFEYKKAQNRHFTYRYFSQRAGLASSGALKEVIDGKKGLSIHSIPKFVEPFGLSKKEALYFEKLVLYNQAREEHEKSKYFQEMIKLQRLPRSRKITPKEYTFYTYWYNSVIREIVALKDFEYDPEWIADHITPKVTAAQVKDAIELLLKLGFVKQEDSKLVQGVPKLSVDPDVTSLLTRNFNRRMIEIGWEAIDRFDQEEREVSGLTLHMSRHVYYQAKEMIRKFKQDLFDFVCNHPAQSEVVCRFNIQLYPFSKNLEKKDA